MESLSNLYKKATSWKYFDYLILSLVVVFIVIANQIWLGLNQRPPHWDMGRHLWQSFVYQSFFGEIFRGKIISGIYNVIFDYKYYPPLLYWLTYPFYLIFGISLKSAVLVNAIFISILTLSVYGIGKHLYNRKIGLLSAILALSMPMIVSQFKEYQLDAPLASLVALSFFLLLKTNEFKDKKWSILFGLSLGFGMLLKWTFAFFLFVPVIFVLGQKIKDLLKNKINFKKINLWKNEILVFVTALIIAGPWYIRNIRKLKRDFAQNGIKQAIIEGDPVSFPQNLIWQFNNLINNNLYFIIFLLFVTGLLVSIFYKKIRAKNLLIIISIISGFAIFTYLPNKDARYILPLVPLISIISVFWIDLAEKKIIKNLLFVVLAVFSVFMFYSVSFGIKSLPKALYIKIFKQHYIVYAQGGYIIGPPQKEKWFQEDMIKEVAKEEGSKLYFVGLDTVWFNNWGLIYYSSLYKVSLVKENELSKGDFFAVRESSNENIEKTVSNSKFKEKLSLVKEYILPDNTILRLYRLK